MTEICPGRVATDIFAHVHGDSPEIRERFIDGFELPEAKDIADAIAFAIAAPVADEHRPHGDHADAAGAGRPSDGPSRRARSAAALGV